MVEVFNSDGVAASDDRTRVRLAAQVVARDGERVETGTDTLGGHAGFELLDGGEETGAKAARRALTLLDAVDAPTGRMPVVVGNGFGGVLLHEAVGHGLEADAVQKRASVYEGKLGESLAPEFVTAYDDGLKPNEWGSDGIDDEGTPTRRTTVIEGGELTSYLYDLLRARKDGVSSTGNGRRQSFRHLPVPRMTNTYFAPGGATVEELIEGVERGLYAVSFGGGQVEPATGDFVFGVSEGYLIEDGRVTAPVRGATLVGNGLEALAALDGDRRRPEDRHRLLRQGRPVGGRRSGPAPRAHPRADRGRDGVSDLEGVARRAVEAAQAAGATQAEGYAEEDRSRQIRVYEGAVESLSDAGGRGVGVRAFLDGRAGHAYGTDLSDDGLRATGGGRGGGRADLGPRRVRRAGRGDGRQPRWRACTRPSWREWTDRGQGGAGPGGRARGAGARRDLPGGGHRLRRRRGHGGAGQLRGLRRLLRASARLTPTRRPSPARAPTS